MPLTPKHPPGRVNRKARAFERDIARLRADGYTCEAIREALADAGVAVSLSTVQREAARCSKQWPLVVARGASLVATADSPATSVPPCIPPGLAGDPRSGREIAEAFVSQRPNNSLLRARIAHEGSRH